MGFNNLLKSLFGDKSTRDMKQIQPIVEKVKAAYPEIKALTNDQLRERTKELQKQLQDAVANEKEQIKGLKSKIEDTPIDEREEIFNQIDKLEKEVLDKYEVVLNEILPVAFSIMKDTARRFAENDEVVVTANDFDRELAATKDFVRIEDDKAIYSNHWMAGGNDLKWDMVHYDVQLFGGIVLHQGKIAEMATGEGKTLVATLPVFLNALTGNGVHVVTVNDYLAKRDSEWMGPLYEFNGLSVDCIDKHRPNSQERRNAYQADITFGTNNEFGFDYLRDNMALSPADLVQRKHNYAIVDEVDSVLIDDARTPLIISGPVPNGDDQMFEEYQPLVEKLVEVQRKLATKYLSEAKQLIAEGQKNNDQKKMDEGFLSLYRSHKALPKNKPLIKYLSEDGIKSGMLKTEEIYMENNNRRMPEAVEPLYFVVDEKLNSVDLTDKGTEWLAKEVNDKELFVLPDITTQLSNLENENLSEQDRLDKKDELLNHYSVQSERVHTLQQLLKAYTMFNKDDEYVVMDGEVKIVDEQTGRIMEGRQWSDGLHQAVEAKEHVKVRRESKTLATITFQNFFNKYEKKAGMTGTALTEEQEFRDIYGMDVIEIPTNRPVIRVDMDDAVYMTKKEKFHAVVEEVKEAHAVNQPVLVGTITIETSELISKMLRREGIPHQVLNAKFHELEAEIVAHAGEAGAVTIATNMAGRGTDIKLDDVAKAAGGLKIIGTERHESRRIDNQLRGRSGRQGDPGESRFYISLEDDLMRLFGSEKLMGIFKSLGVPENEQIEHKMLSSAIEKAQKKIEGNNYGIRKNLLDYDQVNNEQREIIYKERRRVLDGESMRDTIFKMIADTIDNTVDLCIGENTEQSEWDLTELNEMLLSIMPVKAVTKERVEKISKNELKQQLKEEAVKLYEEKEAEFPEEEQIRELERVVLLKVIDQKWMDHIDDMDQLREGIGLQAYGQRDPKVEYKMAAYDMFNEMLESIQQDTVRLLFHVRVEQKVEREQVAKVTGTNKDESGPRKPVQRAERKIYPNDPCPCGSGKKYKQCCGRKPV